LRPRPSGHDLAEKTELDERNNEMVARLKAKMEMLPSGF